MNMANTAVTELRLVPAQAADAERLLAWRNDPVTRAASHQAQEVSASEHHAWLLRSLADPSRRIWLAWLGGAAVGTVRCDRPAGQAHTTLSWTVAPEWRGQGVGSAMLRLALATGPGPWHAEVRLGNRASVRLAESVGLVFDKAVEGTLHFRSVG